MKTIILSEGDRAELQRYAKKQPAASVAPPSSSGAKRPVIIVKRKEDRASAAAPRSGVADEATFASVLDMLLEGMRKGNGGDKVAFESLLKALYNRGVSADFYATHYRNYQECLVLYEAQCKAAAAPGNTIRQAVSAGTQRVKALTHELCKATQRILSIRPNTPEPAQ